MTDRGRREPVVGTGRAGARAGEAGVAGAAVAFGVGSALTVLALGGLSPADMLVVELGGATLVLVPVAALTGRLHTRGALPAMAQGVVLPGLTWLLETLGLARTSATSGSLLLGAETLVTVSLAVLLLRERLNASGAVALFFGLVGTGLVAVAGHRTDQILGDQTVGNLLVIAAVICSATYVVWSRRAATPSTHGIGMIAWQFVGSTLTVGPFVAISWATEGSRFGTATAPELMAAVTVLASTIAAMLAFNRAITSVSASRAGLLLSLQPVAGAMTAAAVLGESLRPGPAIGGALIVTGLLALAKANPADRNNRRPSIAGRQTFERTGSRHVQQIGRELGCRRSFTVRKAAGSACGAGVAGVGQPVGGAAGFDDRPSER